MMMSAFEPAVPIGRMQKPSERRVDSSHEINSGSPPSLSQASFDSTEILGQEGGDENRGSAGPAGVFSDAGETEDEEVKLNCIGGVNGVRDGGMDSSDDEEFESDEDMGSDDGSETNGASADLVNFVARKIEQSPAGPEIQKPTAVTRLSSVPQHRVYFPPGLDESENDDSLSGESSSTNSSSSSGARGLGLSLETAAQPSSDDDGENSSSREDDFLSDEENDSDSGSEIDDEDDVRVEGDVGSIDSEDEGGGNSDDEECLSAHETDDAASNDRRLQIPLPETAGTWDLPSAVAAVSAPERRPSLSLDEIEDMLESSSREKDDDVPDGDEANFERGNRENLSEEELLELFADSLEFDYWSSETVAAVVDALSSVSCSVCHDLRLGKIRFPIRLPRRDDVSFWVDKMGLVTLPESRLKRYIGSNPDRRILASRIIFDAFHTEMTALDLSEVVGNDGKDSTYNAPRLFVGSFSAAESRLGLAVLGIKRVIQISYHPLDELWVSDGVTYSTHILPALGDGGAAPVHEAIIEAAEEVSSTLEEETSGTGKSVLVACSTGDEHACAVCAVYLAKLGITTVAAAKRMTDLRPSCRIDPEWLDSGKLPEKAIHKTKRVLSSNLLSGLNSGMGIESPKRMRCVEATKAPVTMPLLPSLDLGPAAHGMRTEPVGPGLRMREAEEYVSSSTDEEQDRQLSEELEETEDAPDRVSTPVPLLTPPASPVRVEGNEGTTTVCEWPSNLTVDSAMTAAIGLRPLSPSSLQRQETEEQDRLSHIDDKTNGAIRQSSTLLTPLVRGICVKFD